jgi:hypothetical protein
MHNNLFAFSLPTKKVLQKNLKIPCNISSKDYQGNYIPGNNYWAIRVLCDIAGIEPLQENDLIGYSDYDFLPKKIAEMAKNNDQLVLKQNNAFASHQSHLSKLYF